jgi:N-ethylmaleimide reductase
MVRLFVVVTSKVNSTLFTPVKVGPLTLSHRVVMAPMTRQRADQPSGIPGNLPLEYYEQRVSEGGLIISEAIAVSRLGHGGYGSPGLWSDDQVAGWRQITDAVHDGGGFIFAQLWHTGRRSHVTTSFQTPVSPSLDPSFWANPANTVSTEQGYAPVSPHRALDIDEIPSVVEEFTVATRNAAAAGFDGVELHAAYGFLLDQFLQDGSNRRTDRYGGSVANRVRLLMEVVEAVSAVRGADRVAVRISPSSTFNDIHDSDPHTLFGHVAAALDDIGLAYLHVIEPRVSGFTLIDADAGPVASQGLRKSFSGTMIAAGGFEPDTAEATLAAGGGADLIAFARHFVSNPDLPERIAKNLPLTPYDRETFYTPLQAHGYIDYPPYRDIESASA